MKVNATPFSAHIVDADDTRDDTSDIFCHNIIIVCCVPAVCCKEHKQILTNVQGD